MIRLVSRVVLLAALACPGVAIAQAGGESQPRLVGPLTVQVDTKDRGRRSRTCGEMLRRSQDGTKGSSWVIRGCEALVDLVAEEQCANNVKDAGEECGPNDPCPTGKVCSSMCECVDAPPAVCGNGIRETGEACEANSDCPTGQSCNQACACIQAPPPPQCGNGIKEIGEECESSSQCSSGQACSASCACVQNPTGGCPAGARDLTNGPFFSPGIAGLDWVPIGDGETHVYCFTAADSSKIALQINVGDRTGVAQCSWGHYEFISPTGKKYEGDGRGDAIRFTKPMALGTYVVRITQAVDPTCNDKYKITIVY